MCYKNIKDNSFKIALDTIYPPPPLEEWAPNKKILSPDNVLENNKYELIYDEFYDGIEL